MRPEARIEIIARNIPIKEFINSLNILPDTELLAEAAHAATIRWDELIEYWKENPDLRLTQVLVNNKIIPNESGFWYYTEETQWMIENKHLKEGFLEERLPRCAICLQPGVAAVIRDDNIRRCDDCENDRDFYES